MSARSGPAQQRRGNPISLSRAQESSVWQFVRGTSTQNCCAPASSLPLKAVMGSMATDAGWMFNPGENLRMPLVQCPLSLVSVQPLPVVEITSNNSRQVGRVLVPSESSAFVLSVRESKAWWALFRRAGIIPQTGSPWTDLSVCQGLHLHTARCSGVWISPLQVGPSYSHSSAPLPVHFTFNLHSSPPYSLLFILASPFFLHPHISQPLHYKSSLHF